MTAPPTRASLVPRGAAATLGYALCVAPDDLIQRLLAREGVQESREGVTSPGEGGYDLQRTAQGFTLTADPGGPGAWRPGSRAICEAELVAIPGGSRLVVRFRLHPLTRGAFVFLAVIGLAMVGFQLARRRTDHRRPAAPADPRRGDDPGRRPQPSAPAASGAPVADRVHLHATCAAARPGPRRPVSPELAGPRRALIRRARDGRQTAPERRDQTAAASGRSPGPRRRRPRSPDGRETAPAARRPAPRRRSRSVEPGSWTTIGRPWATAPPPLPPPTPRRRPCESLADVKRADARAGDTSSSASAPRSASASTARSCA